jgi:hypothetical protein
MAGKRMRPAETKNNPMGNKGVVTIAQGVSTSTRCRATHDVPYTLRCVLDASHGWVPVYSDPMDIVGAFTMHEDKDGRRW